METCRHTTRRDWFTDFVRNSSGFVPHPASRAAERLPNVLFRTHDGKQVKFYDDLIKGKHVVVNFMYADCEGACPMVTTKLAGVYDVLKDRMGVDLFFLSITAKPDKDDPPALKRYAEMHRADRPGWTFLTGEPYDVETVRFRLFRMNHPGIDLDFASHAGTFRIINDATNVWTMAEAFASQRTIVQHIRWADRPKTAAERVRDNANLQAEIEREVRQYGYRKWV